MSRKTAIAQFQSCSTFLEIAIDCLAAGIRNSSLPHRLKQDHPSPLLGVTVPLRYGLLFPWRCFEFCNKINVVIFV